MHIKLSPHATSPGVSIQDVEPGECFQLSYDPYEFNELLWIRLASMDDGPVLFWGARLDCGRAKSFRYGRRVHVIPAHVQRT